MKKKLSTIIFTLMVLAGFSLLLYPTVSDYWNSKRQNKAIASYEETVANLDEEDYDEILEQAREYNVELAGSNLGQEIDDDMLEKYYKQLDFAEDGLMSYIEIPAIDVRLPIYHGTSDDVLDVGVGHIEWSSLPVGGESTHCVLLAHRGLPSAKLFSNLDKLTEGDTFTLRTLNETLTYEVDQILIVEPGDTSALGITAGKDYCTLVTCTPYGVNTHRLLVRGHRIETLEELSSTYVSAEARQIQPVVVAPFAAIPFILALIIFMHKADDYDEEDEEDYRNENNNYSKYTNDESGKNDSIGKEENSQ